MLQLIPLIGLLLFPLNKTRAEATTEGLLQLQVPLPGTPVGGFKTLADYINTVYTLGIGIVAMVCVIAFIVGGVMYVTSFADSGKISTAKSLIKNAVTGLILVMASYLILFTINPELTNLTLAVNKINRVKMCSDWLSEPTCPKDTCSWLASQSCVEKIPDKNCALQTTPNTCTDTTGCTWISMPICGLKATITDPKALGANELKCATVYIPDQCGINTFCEWKPKGGCVAQAAIFAENCSGKTPEANCPLTQCYWSGTSCQAKGEKDLPCANSGQCRNDYYCGWAYGANHATTESKCLPKIRNGQNCGGTTTDTLGSGAACLSTNCNQVAESYSAVCTVCEQQEDCNSLFGANTNYCNASYECSPKIEIDGLCANSMVAKDADSDCVCKSDWCNNSMSKCEDASWVAGAIMGCDD